MHREKYRLGLKKLTLISRKKMSLAMTECSVSDGVEV